MRKYLVSAVLAVAALSHSQHAHAQAATQDINLQATVTSYCTIGGLFTGAAPAVNPTIIPVTAGVVDTTPINVSTITNVVCNKAANIDTTSLSVGVRNGAGMPPTGTTNVIHYTAVATFGGASSTIVTSSAATGSQGTTSNAAAGNLAVVVTPATPSLPLTPGTYTDTLRVTLTPTP